jgi:hypothetical protein
MSIAGGEDLKTMKMYCRKAGIDIMGITDKLNLHDHNQRQADILKFKDYID